jgi:diacylglycerol O-acyltransferase-1
MVIAVALFSFIVAQIVAPNINSLVQDLEATNGAYTYGILAEYWLKLSIANTYLWLLMFYFYFHLYLNLFAEILRFGDRVFYKGKYGAWICFWYVISHSRLKYSSTASDWWNAVDTSSFWKLWNLPIHYFLV